MFKEHMMDVVGVRVRASKERSGHEVCSGLWFPQEQFVNLRCVFGCHGVWGVSLSQNRWRPEMLAAPQ